MSTRRPLKTRGKNWAISLAKTIAGYGISPNQISVAGIGFGLIAAVLMISKFPGENLAYFLAAAFIQLRLLSNMLDGMVAVEHDKRSKTGELYNELPDRVSDILIITAVGYATASLPCAIELGYCATILALLVAYIRAVGVSLGSPNFFLGPQAKPHRMALVTVALLLQITLNLLGFEVSVLYFALYCLIVGSCITIWRRTAAVASYLLEK